MSTLVASQGLEAAAVRSVRDWGNVSKLVFEYDFEYWSVPVVLAGPSSDLTPFGAAHTSPYVRHVTQLSSLLSAYAVPA